MLLGLQMIVTMGIKKIVVEGDSKITIEALKEPLEECHTEIRNCINDCKNPLNNFDNVILNHVSRTRNNVAHMVAKSSLENKGLDLAIGIIPRDIQITLN